MSGEELALRQQVSDMQQIHIRQRDAMQAEIERLNGVLRGLSDEMGALRQRLHRAQAQEGDDDGG